MGMSIRGYRFGLLILNSIERFVGEAMGEIFEMRYLWVGVGLAMGMCRQSL